MDAAKIDPELGKEGSKKKRLGIGKIKRALMDVVVLFDPQVTIFNRKPDTDPDDDTFGERVNRRYDLFFSFKLRDEEKKRQDAERAKAQRRKEEELKKQQENCVSVNPGPPPVK